MTPRSTPQEAYVWVCNVLHSCENDFHFESAGILIELFRRKYPDERERKQMLTDLLYDKIQDKNPPLKRTHEA